MADLWNAFSDAEQLVLVAFAVGVLIVLAGWALAQLVDPFDEDALTTDGAGADQPADGAERHDNKDVLHAELAPGEEGGEGFGSGGVDVFHAADSFARH